MERLIWEETNNTQIEIGNIYMIDLGKLENYKNTYGSL